MNAAYERITSAFVQQLEDGTVPWRTGWRALSARPANASNQKPYSGFNRLLLGIVAKKYETPYFLTYNQAVAAGGVVNRGEHGFPVAFWQVGNYKKSDDIEEENRAKAKRPPLLRYYTVFNVDQCSGLEKLRAGLPSHQLPELTAEERHAKAEEIAAKSECPIVIGPYNKPSYLFLVDKIEMPKPGQYETRDLWYGDLFHEMAHSTGNSSRLARPAFKSGREMSPEEQAKEELIAEIAASFLLAEAQIDSPTINQNQASYIAGWLPRIKETPQVIIQASQLAEKAANWVMGIRPSLEPEKPNAFEPAPIEETLAQAERLKPKQMELVAPTV